MSAEGIVHCGGAENQPLCSLLFKIEGDRARYSCSKPFFHFTTSRFHTSFCTFRRSIHPPPTFSIQHSPHNNSHPFWRPHRSLSVLPSSSSSQAPFSSAAAPRTQLTDFEWPAMSERASVVVEKKSQESLRGRARARSVPARMAQSEFGVGAWRRRGWCLLRARLPRSEAMCQYHRPLSPFLSALFSLPPFPAHRRSEALWDGAAPSGTPQPRSLSHPAWMAERANHFPSLLLPADRPSNHSIQASSDFTTAALAACARTHFLAPTQR